MVGKLLELNCLGTMTKGIIEALDKGSSEVWKSAIGRRGVEDEEAIPIKGNIVSAHNAAKDSEGFGRVKAELGTRGLKRIEEEFGIEEWRINEEREERELFRRKTGSHLRKLKTQRFGVAT